MSFRMEFIPASGAHRFTLGCSCGAVRTWDNESCYVAWRAAVVESGWKADWPERCPACPAETQVGARWGPGETQAQGVLPL